MKRIFISHASKDKEIIDGFIDLILQNGMGIGVDDIFCTSSEGMKILSGEDWRQSIQENLAHSKVIILIISPYYKESEICLNEMGAAWMMDSLVLPLIIEPINFSSVGAIQEPKQVEKLFDSKSLDRIKDRIQETLELPVGQIKSDRWTTKKMEFVSKGKTVVSNNPYPVPVTRDEVEELLVAKDDMEKTIMSLIEEKDQLVKFNEELKLAKDADQVKQIIDKHDDSNTYDKFEKLRQKVRDNLKQFDGALITAFFKSIARKDIELGWANYRKDLEYGIAHDYINEEGETDWESTYPMRELKTSIDQLKYFMENEEGEEVREQVEKEYKTTFSIANQDFWESAFNTSLFY